MAYRGFSGGGFVGNHLTTALLEALRPAADNAGRHATVGDPSTTAAPYISDGESWKSVPLVSADGLSLVSGDGILIPVVGGMSAEVSAAAATANTARIQAALTAGGLVQILAPGTYYINDTLTIYSNTDFLLGEGVKLKMADSAGGKPLLQNYAFSRRASAVAVTLTWSSGITAAITGWTAHGCEVGDYVWLQGATLSCYNIVGYLSAADSAAGTATVVLLRLPSGAVSGTIEALKCDRNITVRGGIFDYNYPSNTAGDALLTSHAINLGIVQNLKLLGVQAMDAQKYCFMTGAVRDFHYEDCGTQFNNSDLLKVFGPAVNGIIKNTWGSCGDDGVSVQTRVPSAFVNMDWTYGDCIGVHVDGTDINTSLAGVSICGFYPSQNEKMIGMKASRIGGYAAGGYGVKCFAENSASDTIDSLEIDTITANCIDGFKTQQTGGGLIIRRLVIRGLQSQMQSTSSTQMTINGSTTIESGDVSCVINDAAFGASGSQYAVVLNGGFYDLTLRGKVNGGSTGRFCNVLSQSAGTIGTLRTILDQRTGDTAVVVPATSVAGGVYEFTGCDTVMAAIINLTVNGTIIFGGGNKFHNASNGLVRPTSTPTIDIRSDGSNKLTGTSAWIVVPSGTPVLTVYGWDIAIDPITVTGLAGTVGQFCTSTQAGNESGLAVRGNVNGTPAWYSLAGGAAGVNAAIT